MVQGSCLSDEDGRRLAMFWNWGSSRRRPRTKGWNIYIHSDSSWTVLQRKVAWLLKFKAYIQYRKDEKADIKKDLTTADLEKETLTIVKLVQREVYAGFAYQRQCQTCKQDCKSPTHIGWLHHESWRSHCRCPYCVWCQTPHDCSTKTPCSLATDCKTSSEIITCWTRSHPCALKREVLDTQWEVCRT